MRSNHIKVLNLVGYRIGSSGASYISDSIKHNTTLTYLDLFGNKDVSKDLRKSIKAELKINKGKLVTSNAFGLQFVPLLV